jgi:hypothetical protein
LSKSHLQSEWVSEWRERKWEKTTKKGNQPIWRLMCRENNEYSTSSKEVQTFYKPVQRTITKFFEKLMKMGASDFVSFRVKKHDSNPKIHA